MVTPQSLLAHAAGAASAENRGRERRVADALRRIARGEAPKARLDSDPLLRPFLLRAADRYTGGRDLATFGFETLYGLGHEQIDQMRNLGHATRQYIVYGREWFLYVCHRIAEHPPRLFDALADVLEARA
jgi:hypothetical protein